jgi:hypothetical protein
VTGLPPAPTLTTAPLPVRGQGVPAA